MPMMKNNGNRPREEREEREVKEYVIEEVVCMKEGKSEYLNF